MFWIKKEDKYIQIELVEVYYSSQINIGLDEDVPPPFPMPACWIIRISSDKPLTKGENVLVFIGDASWSKAKVLEIFEDGDYLVSNVEWYRTRHLEP